LKKMLDKTDGASGMAKLQRHPESRMLLSGL
jgi:hypothetical protein